MPFSSVTIFVVCVCVGGGCGGVCVEVRMCVGVCMCMWVPFAESFLLFFQRVMLHVIVAVV